MEIPNDGKTVITTHGSNVLCNPFRDDTNILAPCTHEEADTRIMVHLADAVKEGHKDILIRTVDTDVVALAISCMQTTSAD